MIPVGEELFVVAFVELFVVGRRVSGLADDKAVSCCIALIAIWRYLQRYLS